MKRLRFLLQSVNLHTVLHIDIVQLILRLHIIHACVLYVHVHKTYNTIKCTLFCKLSHWKVNCMFTCCFTQDVYGVGGDLSQTNKLVLSYLSYLGCGISLLGLILTLVTYFSFRYLVVQSLGF